MLKEFKEFAIKGNVIDLAVGIVIGAAFGKIVTSLVNDVLMPPLGFLMGRMDFSQISLGPVRIGIFINTVIDFLIVAFAIFLVIKQLNKLKNASPPKPAEPSSEEKLLIEIRDLLKK